jgi:hypothetical protein
MIFILHGLVQRLRRPLACGLNRSSIIRRTRSGGCGSTILFRIDVVDVVDVVGVVELVVESTMLLWPVTVGLGQYQVDEPNETLKRRLRAQNL